LDRADPAVQRGSLVALAGQRLDAVDRLQHPHPHPRLPARGPPRRADARGRLVTYPPGTGERFDARALWRRQRDRWHHLPERTRRIVVLVAQVVIVVALLPWYGFAALLAIFFALSWIPDDLVVP